MKTQQFCQNLVRSSLLPENGKGILSFISLGEAVGVEEEAMLLLLGGPRFSWEKRSRREFGSLGLGSKWKESDKESMSPMLFFLVYTLGISSVFIHSFIWCMRDKNQVFIWWEHSFVMTLRNYMWIPTVNNRVVSMLSFGTDKIRWSLSSRVLKKNWWILKSVLSFTGQ